MPHKLESKPKYESDKLQFNRYQAEVQTSLSIVIAKYRHFKQY